VTYDNLPQHHFVVYYDTKTENWAVDWDLTDSHLPDGQIFMNNGWETADEEEVIGKDYYRKAEELVAHLNTLHSKPLILAPSLGSTDPRDDDD